MYLTLYILVNAPQVPRNTGINISPLTKYIYIQQHTQQLPRRLNQPNTILLNNEFRLISAPFVTIVNLLGEISRDSSDYVSPYSGARFIKIL